MVLFSTILFGALMPIFIKFFKSFDNKENFVELKQTQSSEGVKFDYLHPNFSQDNIPISKETNQTVLEERLSYWLMSYCRSFDQFYLKPKLIYNWPNVMNEHQEISNFMKEKMEEFKKMKNNIIEPNDKDYCTTLNNNESLYGTLLKKEAYIS